MDTATVVALVLAGLAAIATAVPWLAYRLLLRRDAIRWLRERRAELYVEMLTEAYAERYYVTFAASNDAARELMGESFTATDTRLAPRERSRLGASSSAFASHKVNGLYALLFAEAWLVTVNPARFRSDEARMQVMKRIVGILGDLEMAIRHELGADQIPRKTGPPGTTPDSP